MVARGPGAVGCAHCTMIGADRACPICTRLVCEACGADWTTCGEPSGRVIRLGLTARLRDVDPLGRIGLVSHWRQPLRLFDLRQLRWIDGVRLPRGAYLFNRRFPPRLTSDLRAIYAEWSAGSGYERSDSRMFAGMRVLDVRTQVARTFRRLDAPEHGTAVSAKKDLFYYVTDTQRIGVLDGETSYTLDPMPRKVIQAAHLDAERELLATASWSEIALHRIVDGTLHLIARRKTDTTGDVTAIGVAGPFLVATVQRFAGAAIVEVYRLGVEDSLGPLVDRPLAGAVRHTALSRDGRYLAVARGDHLHVRELGTDNEQRFDEHTDRINLVRFAGDDHLLVTADTDNRVVMRPRTSAGYATPLVALEVPDLGVSLPHETRAAGP